MTKKLHWSQKKQVSHEQKSYQAAKLSADDVRRIRNKLLNGQSPKSIAQFFQVSVSCVYAIKNGKTWDWVPSGPDKPHYK